jgi:hypothetical protein
MHIGGEGIALFATAFTCLLVARRWRRSNTPDLRSRIYVALMGRSASPQDERGLTVGPSRRPRSSGLVLVTA